MKKLFVISIIVLLFSACSHYGKHKTKTRAFVDTVGYATTAPQMDSIMARIQRVQSEAYKDHLKFENDVPAKAVLCPHDDYAYVGELYPATLQNIRAKTVIIFGVVHKATKFHLENKIIFDSYDFWKGPYGAVPVSDMREKIMKNLPKGMFQVNDTMQHLEHSVEALVPFLQYFNRHVQIVSILVPAMPYDRMEEISKPLSKAIEKVAKQEGMQWGKDFAFVISSDAVHYGDEDWGGSNFAYYGTSCISYKDAKEHEIEILHTLAGPLSPHKIKLFTQYTVQDNDFRKYKWTWCGRYSIPLGLLTAIDLQALQKGGALHGRVIGYTSSLVNLPLPVKDIGMGVTAPAYDHHWVGYAAIRYD